MERSSFSITCFAIFTIFLAAIGPSTSALSESAPSSLTQTLHPKKPYGPTSGIVFPILAPKFSSGYGSREHPVFHRSKHHNGLDIAAPEYSHVRTILEGTVIFAGNYAGFGKLVTIQHQGGTASLYGHLSEIRVNVGHRVKTGEIIGRVGSTGWSTGSHLHFEWRKNGVSIDPLVVFPFLFEDAKG